MCSRTDKGVELSRGVVTAPSYGKSKSSAGVDETVPQRIAAGRFGERTAREYTWQARRWMLGRPVFGPTDRGAAAGLYNARPGPLAGWGDLVRAVESIRPRLVIIDPVLAAYVGDSNGVAPVREFLGPLACLAGTHSLGVLLIAHSNKAARKAKDADPLDPGQVGGSGHWFDTVRGVLVLNRSEDRAEGRVLACPKSNRGPDRLVLPLNPIRGGQGQPLGFLAANEAGWRTPPPSDERRSSRANGHRRDAQPERPYAHGVD